MLENKMWMGINNLLDNYAKIQKNDQVVIAYTPDSRKSAAWVFFNLQKRNINVKKLWMSPLHDQGFFNRFSSALPTDTKDRLVIFTFERNTMSHDKAIKQAIANYNKETCVVIRAISSCDELFSSALHASPSSLSARNTTLLENFMKAERLHIKTHGGSDIKVLIDKRHRWISNRGVWRPGSSVILPAGEVATFPDRIDGVFVADFAFNINAITERDSQLSKYPMKIWIEGGRVTNYTCDDPNNLRFLDDTFKKYCVKNVGELGFGTNFCVNSSIAMNSHINERKPGIHLGFGQHNQRIDVVNYRCEIHLDLIAKGGIVWIDDNPDPIDLENIQPSINPHPKNSYDEDVYSPEIEDLEVDDCCGILTNEGLNLFD